MPTEPRVKLGETPLLKALGAISDYKADSVETKVLWFLQDVGFLQQTDIYSLTEWGEALLQAADLWDALPEADPVVVTTLLDDDPLKGRPWPQTKLWQYAADYVAAALEAQRREDETNGKPTE